MCGTFQSKFQRSNKVAPAPCPFEQEVLRKAKILIEKEKALLKKEVAIQTKTSLLCLNNETRRCETPSCITYDLNWDGKIVAKGLKTSYPRRLAKDPKFPVLTREMLLEKQTQAEENRNNQFEKKREAALKSLQARERKLKDEEKLHKVATIHEKLIKAAENRQAQLEDVKTKAKKTSNSTRYKIAEARSFARAQQKLNESERKIQEVKANRDSVVSKVVSKQQQREARAQKIRQRVVKQIEEEEDCVHVFDDLEVDPHFYASNSDSDQNDMWDAKFWDRKV